MRALKTTPLLTFEVGAQAMHKAAQAEYGPPRSEIPTNVTSSVRSVLETGSSPRRRN